MQAWLAILSRAKHTQSHQVVQEAVSVRERMSAILRRLSECRRCPFSALFSPERGAAGVVVDFIALLELVKEGMARVRQETQFGEIEVLAAEEG